MHELFDALALQLSYEGEIARTEAAEDALAKVTKPEAAVLVRRQRMQQRRQQR